MVVIACEYSCHIDQGRRIAIVVPPGTTPALALGLAHRRAERALFDADYVPPMDGPPHPGADGHAPSTCGRRTSLAQPPAQLSNQTARAGAADQPAPPPLQQTDMLIPDALREQWGDYVWWDRAGNQPQQLTRDQVGSHSQVGDAALGRIGGGHAGRRRENSLPACVRPGPGVCGAFRPADGPSS